MKKRILSLMFTAVLLMVLAGFDIAKAAEENETEIPEFPDTTYEEIIDWYYEVLCADYIDFYTYYDELYGVMEIKNEGGSEKAMARIGYFLTDLDGNGIEELIIADQGDDRGSRVLTLYTMYEDKPIVLASGRSKERIYILEDNMIYSEGVASAVQIGLSVKCISKDGRSLDLVEHYYPDFPDWEDRERMALYYSIENEIIGEMFIGEMWDDYELFIYVEDGFSAEIQTLDVTLFSEYKKSW